MPNNIWPQSACQFNKSNSSTILDPKVCFLFFIFSSKHLRIQRPQTPQCLLLSATSHLVSRKHTRWWYSQYHGVVFSVQISLKCWISVKLQKQHFPKSNLHPCCHIYKWASANLNEAASSCHRRKPPCCSLPIRAPKRRQQGNVNLADACARLGLRCCRYSSNLQTTFALWGTKNNQLFLVKINTCCCFTLSNWIWPKEPHGGRMQYVLPRNNGRLRELHKMAATKKSPVWQI